MAAVALFGAVAALLYAIGLVKLWGHAGAGRGIGVRHALCFATGWLTLMLALAPPLDELAEQQFAAHMVQHELLMIVAAPLLVLGRPLATWAWALAPVHRRNLGGWVNARGWSAFWRAITGPLAAWALHAVALWGWHLPAAFDAALQSEGVHIAQHASFLVTALLFWWAVLGRRNAGHAFALLFTTMLHTSALGALLALAPTPWYTYGALDDQQLGGLIMWVPASLAYLVAALRAMTILLSASAASADRAWRHIG